MTHRIYLVAYASLKLSTSDVHGVSSRYSIVIYNVYVIYNHILLLLLSPSLHYIICISRPIQTDMPVPIHCWRFFFQQFSFVV